MNIMNKKRISVLISVIIALSMLFVCMTTVVAVAVDESAQSGELYAEEITMGYDDGNNHTYRVYFTPDQKFTSFSMELEFPSFVRLEAVTPNYSLGNENGGQMAGSISGGTGVYTFETKDNVLSIALSNTVDITEQTRLFSVEIYAKQDLTQTGDVFVRECTIIDSAENELAVSFNLGSITVNQKEKLGMMGDMDSDNDVDLVDLVTVQRSITALSGNYELTELQRELADINGDDIIDIVDCQLIREYIAGILESLENYGGTNTPVEPENPDDNEPTEYAMSVWYIGESGQFEFSGEYYVPEGQSVVDTLTQIASGYNAEVQGFYYDSSFTEQIPSSYLADKDMEVWVMLAPSDEARTFELKVFLNGEFNRMHTATAGDNILAFVYDCIAVADEVEGVYYDAEKTERVDEVGTVDQDREIHVFTKDYAQENPLYTVTLYANSETGWDYAGQLEVPEGDYLYSSIEKYLGPALVYVSGIYYDSEMNQPVLGEDIINSNIDVYIYSDMGNSELPQTYTVTFYVMNENGEWDILKSDSYHYEYIIWEAIYALEEEGVFVESAYFDQDMRNAVGRDEYVTDNISIYLLTKVETEGYTITLYGNTKDGGFEYIMDIPVAKDADIYATIMGMLSEEAAGYIDGIYYDMGMTQLVPQGALFDGNMSIYLYSSVAGEDIWGGGSSDVNKENMLFFDIRTSDGEFLDGGQVYIMPGDRIIDALRAYLCVYEIEAYYDEGEWIEIDEDTTYDQNRNNGIIVVANKIQLYAYMKSNAGVDHMGVFTGYAFVGEYVDACVFRTISKYGIEFDVMGMYADAEMQNAFTGKETVSQNIDVYVMFQGKIVDENNCYLGVRVFEQKEEGKIPMAGQTFPVAKGDNILESAKAFAENSFGSMYTIIGYYYDEECTVAVGENDEIQQESSTVYVVVKVKDFSGTYPIMDMNEGAMVGTLELGAQSTAKITIGEDEIAGEWNSMMGMFFVYVGDYSQYIFAIQEMPMPNGESTVIAMMALEFNAEKKPNSEEYAPYAGYYTWEEKYVDENGETITETYSITFYANGVYETVQMGMKLRGPYTILTENVIAIDVMGDMQYFTIDVNNNTLEVNNLARFVGERDLYSKEDSIIGRVEINYDGSATAPVDGVQKEGTIKYESGNLYFYYGEYDVLVIYCNNNDEGELINFRLEYSFQGSDYEENSAFDAYVGEYELQMHGDTLNTIEFMSNGTFYMYGDKFMTVLGRYEITDTGLKIYYFDSEDWTQEIVYDEISARYILKDLMMNQNGGMGTTQPEEKQ